MYLSVFTRSFFTFWDLHLVPPLLIYWVFSVYPLSLSLSFLSVPLFLSSPFASSQSKQ